MLAVQTMNAEDAVASCHGLLEHEVGKAAVPRTRDVLERRCGVYIRNHPQILTSSPRVRVIATYRT